MQTAHPASGTRQRLNFEDASQQLGPAPTCLAQGVGLRVDLDERLFLDSVGGLAAFSPHARCVEAVVALQYLALVWDVVGEPSEELEGIRSLTARRRTRRLVGVVRERCKFPYD